MPSVTGPSSPTLPVTPGPVVSNTPSSKQDSTPTGGSSGPQDAFTPGGVTGTGGATPKQTITLPVTHDFDLIPGRYPDAVGLPDVLNQLSTTPEGQQQLQALFDDLQKKTGVTIPPELEDAVKTQPTSVLSLFELTPEQLSLGVDALNKEYQAGKIKPSTPAPNILPDSFDFANLPALSVPRPPMVPKQVAQGLYYGDLPGTLTDEQYKTAKVTAEVLQRLSDNLSKPTGQKFQVTYKGQTFTELVPFLKALKDDGHEITISFDQRCANFSDLKTQVPNSNPPQWLDVPAPLMIRTGVHDASGKEAIIPAVHGQMIINIHKGPNTTGPGIDTRLSFFQGLDTTGFFPSGDAAQPSWCGYTSHDPLSGDDALKALDLAGLYSDVIAHVAKDDNLWHEGYGVTGVCNDSVGLIQQALTGHTTMYPLVMQQKSVMAELKKRLANTSDPANADYKLLETTLSKMPNDLSMSPSAAERASAALPWAPGKEPFKSSEDARTILA